MKNFISLLSVCIFIFSAGQLHAQSNGATSTLPEFGPAVSAASLTIGSDKHAGYASQFDFDPKSLKKGWWKYLKTVARVKNRKTYWRLSVPPRKGSSNVPIEMFSQIDEKNGKSTLILALNSTNMEAATRKEYMQQTKNFLEEFKAKFYRDYVQELLENAEKRATKASKDHGKEVARKQKLESKLAKVKANQSGNEPTEEETELLVAIQEADSLIIRKFRLVEDAQAEITYLKKTLLAYIRQNQN